MRGQVRRYCSCRGEDGKQLGARCPQLDRDGKHGAWSFKVDLPRVNGRRKEVHRRGFRTKKLAEAALQDVVARHDGGIAFDDRESTGDRLLAWLPVKQQTLKPSSAHMYGEYVRKQLVPRLGSIRLERLRHEHVQQLVDDLIGEGKGATTVRRIVATLSSAMTDAVKQRRLQHNPCEHVTLPKVDKAERKVWTVAEAVQFLDYVTRKQDPLAELFETIIGTGLRRGEVLALRWPFIDVEARSLWIDPKRGNLSGASGRLAFTAPKTTGSAAGVGLSGRVVAALTRQAERQAELRQAWGSAYEDDQLVFCRENGSPLRPEYVLRRFHELTEEAKLPKVTVHDLRHLAATIMLTSGVPLPVASKMLRHSKVGITSDLYGHLTREASHAAADGLAAVLDAAAAEKAAEARINDATTVRPLAHLPELLRR